MAASRLKSTALRLAIGIIIPITSLAYIYFIFQYTNFTYTEEIRRKLDPEGVLIRDISLFAKGNDIKRSVLLFSWEYKVKYNSGREEVYTVGQPITGPLTDINSTIFKKD